MADFHAADLWVAIVPDASKIGPAMEAAGKEAKGKFREGVKDFGKAIHEDLDRVAAKSKDVFSGMGKELKTTFSKESFRADIELTSRQISEGFKKAGQVAGQAFNSELGQQIKQVAAEELGALVGEKIGTAIGNSPIGQSLRSAVESAAPAFDHIRDTIGAIRDRDAGTALKGMSDALRDMGQSKAADTLADVSTKAGELQAKVGPLKTDIEGTARGLSGIAGNSGKVAGGLNDIAGAAGPLAIAFTALDTLMPGFDQHLHNVIAQLQGIKDFNWRDWANTLAPGTNLMPSSDNVRDFFTPPKIQSPVPIKPGEVLAPAPAVVAPPVPGVGPIVPSSDLPPGLADLAPLDRPGHASGGPIRGPGAIGKDSVFMMGAPGEHVVTAGEVNAVGGQRGMYELRGLMRAGFFKNIRGYQGGGAVDWEHIASAESGGNWGITYGEGPDVTGGLQIATATWLSHGGGRYAPKAYLATKSQQIEIAEAVLASQGPTAWPTTYRNHPEWFSGGRGGGGGIGGSDFGAATGSPTGPPPDENSLRRWVQDKFGIPNTFGTGSWENKSHPKDQGWHGKGFAFDFHGTPQQMAELSNWIADHYAKQTLELIYGGAGFDQNREIKNAKFGNVYGAGTNAGHTDHVHWALTVPPDKLGAEQGEQPTGSPAARGGGRPEAGAGGGGGGGMEGQGQQLAKGFASGILEIFGLDGSVFKGFGGGKSPLDFGAFKLFTGLMHGISSPGGGAGGGGGGGGGGLPGLDTLLNPGAAISAALAPAAGGPAAATGGDTHNYYGDVGKFEVNQHGVGDTGVNDWQHAANSSGRARAMDAWAPAQ